MAKNKDKKVPRPSANPHKSVPPSATRQRVLAPADASNFRVRWVRFDFDGPWCLSRPEGDVVQLMKRIKSFETMSPLRIFGTTDMYPGTDYEVARIPNQDALRRLTELGFGDETQISRIRIGGAPRFYGFRRDPEFYAIFWDPMHEIWPSLKK